METPLFNDPERLRHGMRRYQEEPDLHDIEPRFRPVADGFTGAEKAIRDTYTETEEFLISVLNPDQLQIEFGDDIIQA